MGSRFVVQAVAVLVAIGLVAIGCGSDDSAAEAQRTVLGAAQRTYTEATAQVAFTLTGAALGDIAGEGSVDFDNVRSAVTATAEGIAATVFQDGTTTIIQPGTGDDGDDGDDDEGEGDPGGLEPEDDLIALIEELLLLFEPAQLVLILGGVTDAEELGTTTIDGVEVTRYAVTIDLQAALDALEGDQADAFAQAIARLGTTTLDAEVAIEDEGRLRQLDLTLTTASGDSIDTTATFTDYGEPVDITIPDPIDTDTVLNAPEAPDDLEDAAAETDELDGTYELEATAAGQTAMATFTLDCDPTACAVTEQGIFVNADVTEAERSGNTITLLSVGRGPCAGVDDELEFTLAPDGTASGSFDAQACDGSTTISVEFTVRRTS